MLKLKKPDNLSSAATKQSLMEEMDQEQIAYIPIEELTMAIAPYLRLRKHAMKRKNIAHRVDPFNYEEVHDGYDGFISECERQIINILRIKIIIE